VHIKFITMALGIVRGVSNLEVLIPFLERSRQV